MNNTIKPFVGLHLGLTNRASVYVIDSKIPNVVVGLRSQLTPQAGFRVGPLNIWASYQSGFMVNGGFVFGFGKFEEE